MANLEDLEEEIRELRVQNSELALEVQTLRMTAAQRDKEKLDLMKTINDLRLKLTRLKSRGVVEARKLASDLQAATEEAISHLVQASGAALRSVDLAKKYMLSTQELDSTQSPRWSNLSGTPSRSSSKVNKVPPLWIGGQSIQPVVSLSRTLLSSSARLRTPTQNMNGQERAVPMRMLQDVYIPLTRLNLPEMHASDESDVDSTEELGLQENGEQISQESENNVTEDIDEARRLYDVTEEPEDEDDKSSKCNQASSRTENPLEGPSWLLDGPQTHNQRRSRSNLEPDSTTPCEEQQDDAEKENEPRKSFSLVYTPTVRRPKRASPSPAPLSPIRNSNRVLKVVVAKMGPNELQGVAKRRPSESQGGSPPKIAKLYSSTPTRDAPRRRSTVDSILGSPRSPAISPSRSNEASSQREFNRSRSPQTKCDEPGPNGTTDAGGVVLKTSARKNVTQRKHTPSYVSNNSDDDSNVGDHDVNQRHNVNERRKSNACNIRQGIQHSSTHCDLYDRNVSKRYNLNERHSSESYGDIIEIGEGDHDARNVNKCRDTQRDTSNKDDPSDRYDGNISETQSIYSENDPFRGFVSERAGRTERHVIHDERERNVNDSSDRNGNDGHNKNVSSSRVKQVNKNRDKKVSRSRDRDVNESCDKIVGENRDERERNVNDSSDRNENDSHNRNVSSSRVKKVEKNRDKKVSSSRDRDVNESCDKNVGDNHDERDRNVNDSSDRNNESDSQNKKVSSSRVKKVDKNRDKKVSSSRDRDVNESRDKNVVDNYDENVLTNSDRNVNVTERNASERHERNVAERCNRTRNKRNFTKPLRCIDTDDSERSTSCQSNDVESDSSSDFEWGRGRSRARRSRKKVTYTEMPLNKKLRR